MMIFDSGLLFCPPCRPIRFVQGRLVHHYCVRDVSFLAVSGRMYSLYSEKNENEHVKSADTEVCRYDAIIN